MTKAGEIEFALQPRQGSKPICGSCGKKGATYDHTSLRRFEFVPLWGIAVFFVYRMRRVDCRACGVTTERIPWSCGKHQQTFSYRLFLATRPQVPNVGVPTRPRIQETALRSQRSDLGKPEWILRPFGLQNDRGDQVRLYRYVASLPESPQGPRIVDAEHSGPIPYRQEVWRSLGQSPSGRNSTDVQVRLRIGAEKFPMEHSETSQQSHDPSDGEASRVAPIQPENDKGLPDARGLQSVLELHVADVGIEVPSRMVHSSRSLAD